MVRQISGINGIAARQTPTGARPAGAPSFGSVLESTLQRGAEMKISAHAEARLRDRNITLGRADMERISRAASKVAEKGGRDALVVMDNVGLIVDVRNRTVVTAIERERMNENVFTNIDSAVFA